MRFPRSVLLLAIVLPASVAPARAEGRWCASLSAGESVSHGHGSALDAALFAEVSPSLGLGVETGFAYMKSEPSPIVISAVDRATGGVLGGLSDGITRNRGYYLGPAVKVGTAVYAVASTGLYEFSDNAGRPADSRWGASAGVGVSGPGRFEPRGELRYRWSRDATHDVSAFLIMLGVQIR